jgi:hypothetical protein
VSKFTVLEKFTTGDYKSLLAACERVLGRVIAEQTKGPVRGAFTFIKPVQGNSDPLAQYGYIGFREGGS